MILSYLTGNPSIPSTTLGTMVYVVRYQQIEIAACENDRRFLCKHVIGALDSSVAIGRPPYKTTVLQPTKIAASTITH